MALENTKSRMLPNKTYSQGKGPKLWLKDTLFALEYYRHFSRGTRPSVQDREEFEETVNGGWESIEKIIIGGCRKR